MRTADPAATAQNVLMASIAVGAILGIISATVSPSGWLFTLVRILDGAVFVVAIVIWLISRIRPARRPDQV